ncbi:hypothetical protein BST91_08260 [Nonlabens tegetincola]|uniref:hypothetical protein n=1 Tax=Nonlabens tegetincola TaxID=323273 RepID=UPI000A209A61|nr:hypothetical protein [Nonlabens tegetincola]ARN71632.1 hypothetical protein BST91_08260 [Nonlabens tegetincola]
MNLYTRCTSCGNHFNLKIKGKDRVEIKMKYGDSIASQCSHCHTQQSTPIKKIKAETNQLIISIGFIIGAVAFLSTFFFIGKYLALGKAVYFIYGGLTSLPFLLWRIEEKSVRSFNSTYVK